MDNKIFYFSATGKSFWAALTLANELTNCDIIAMKDYDTDKPIFAQKIGFVFPVYHGGIPDTVKRFLSEIKIDGCPYLFSIHTYNDNDGITSLQIREKMLSCDTPINAVFPLRMQQNNSRRSYTDIFGESAILKMLKKAQTKICKIAQIISCEENYLKNSFKLFRKHKHAIKKHLLVKEKLFTR
jgi:putative NADPH-quinone reductase